MTNEQLKKGEEIANEIESLKYHRENILQKNSGPEFDTSKFKLLVDPNQDNADKRQLKSKFLPFPVENLIELYLSKLDKTIIELEKEFKKL